MSCAATVSYDASQWLLSKIHVDILDCAYIVLSWHHYGTAKCFALGSHSPINTPGCCLRMAASRPSHSRVIQRLLLPHFLRKRPGRKPLFLPGLLLAIVKGDAGSPAAATTSRPLQSWSYRGRLRLRNGAVGGEGGLTSAEVKGRGRRKVAA